MWRYWSVPAVIAIGSCLLYWQAPTFSRPVPAVQRLHDPKYSAALTALERPVAWDFTDLPLERLPGLLNKELGLPAVIEKRALEDESIGTDTLISCQLSGVSAAAALRITLRKISLRYKFADECLVITTEDSASTALETRVYPVADLVQVVDEKGHNTDYDSLINAIMSAVHPESWKDNGTGEAVISSCKTAGALVISQTSEEHAAVEQLLDRLRWVRTQQGIWGPVRTRSQPPFNGAISGVTNPANSGNVNGAMSGTSGGFF